MRQARRACTTQGYQTNRNRTVDAAASAAPKVASRYLIQDDSAGAGVGAAAARSSSLTSFGSTVATPCARAGAGAPRCGGDRRAQCRRSRAQSARPRRRAPDCLGPLGFSRRGGVTGAGAAAAEFDRLLLRLRLCRLGAGRSARCALARSSVALSRPDASPHAHPGAVPLELPSCAPVRPARPWPAPRSSPARPTRSGTESDRCRRPAHGSVANR